MKIIGIMACDPKGVIGYKNALPWHEPQDLEFFRSMTNNQLMIMGRKTFDSLPKNLLINRKAIILSSTAFIVNSDIWVAHSLKECINYLSQINPKKCFMIGGGQISTLFLKNNLIQEFFLTIMDKEYIGDRFIDLKLLEIFNKVSFKRYDNFTIYHYLKDGGQGRNRTAA